MSTLWAVQVYPFEQDPYATTYLFENIAEAQAFADRVNNLPEQDRIFLCGGRGSTVSVWSTELTTAEDAYNDLKEHYYIEED